MAVLRNVPKTFSFEEQRIEINEIAQDLYDLNVTASGIALTDISVVKPNPTASGSGDVTYDSSNGQFTYTPPELNFLTDLGDAIVDGDFTTGGLMKTDGAGNYSVIHDHSTEWDEAHDWGNHANAGYLTSLPSHTHDLEDLGDVTITGADAPSDGEALVWDQTAGKWKASQIEIVGVNQFSAVNTGTAGNGAGHLHYDQSNGLFTFSPATVFSGSWNDLTDQPAIPAAQVKSDWTATGTIAEILNKPTLVTNINDLGDVDTTGIVGGKILKSTASGTWVIADDDTGTSINALNDIGDVNVGGTITDGHVLKWDLASTKWVAAPDLTSSGGSGIALTDISVVKPNPNASGSGDVTYNSTSGAFTYTPPSIPAAQVKSDWDSSTGLSEILNKPTLVENLGDLGDVDTTGAVNGKILKHNGTSWEIADDLTSGGGSASFTGLSDTPNSLSAGKWLKVNAGATALEWTDAPILSNIVDSAQGVNVTGKVATSDGIDIDIGGGINAAGTSIDFQNTTISFSGASIGGLQSTINAGVDVHLNKSTAGNNEVLSWNGTDYDWVAQSGGTTYNVVSTSADGLAPQLPSSHGGKFLKADGTWEIPAYIANTDTTYSVVDTVNHGLCPVLVAANDKFLRSDGSWADAPGEANVQSDWDQSNSTAPDYIENKPVIPTNLDNLNDVSIGSVSEGKILKYTSGSWSAADETSGGGGATYLNQLTDVTTGTISNGDVLQYSGTSMQWEATAPSVIPSGTIVMYNSGSAPSGWAVCDGNNGTPDLRGRFIVASGGNISGSGGYADAVLIQHSHEYNFTSSGSAAGAHSHTAGNYTTNNTGTHSHNQSGSGSGSGTTGTQSANHYHTTSTTVNTGSDGSHQHRWGTNDLIGAGGGNNNPDAAGGTDWRAWTDTQGAHSHTFNFTHDTLGVSENHTHDFNFNYNIGGSTGNDGAHSHSVNGNTNNTGSHGHSFNLGDVSGQHSSVTVATGNSPATNRNLPPYYTLTYIMKL